MKNKTIPPKQSKRYCGRDFSGSEIAFVRTLIADQPTASRAQLSRLVCKHLNWRRPDGRLKDMSCRVAMLRMQNDQLIELPPPRNGNNNGKPYRRRTQQAEPPPDPVVASTGMLPDLNLRLVTGSGQSHLWNEYIDRYHYLGYNPLPGAQLRYFARSGKQIIALFGFGASAWSTAPRDRFIGWNSARRQERLHLIVNNARFLILPWVHCYNLASKLLSMVTHTLADDWEACYHYRPVLAETFVEKSRFRGTCYKAANWSYLGETQGTGKLGREKVPVKTIWVYPLIKDFRLHLCR